MFPSDGEWLTCKHGTHHRRRYRKVHLAIDTATGRICAVELPFSDKGKSPVRPYRPDQISPEEQIGTAIGDGAFGIRRWHTAILERGGTAVILLRKCGRRWKEDCPADGARSETLRAPQRLGRTIWKRWSGYHLRSWIEAKMRCLNACVEGIASCDPDHQTAEIHMRVALINRFNVPAPPGSKAWNEIKGKRVLIDHAMASETMPWRTN